MSFCSTPCDDDCDSPCHEGHQVPPKRRHDEDACPGTLNRDALDAGTAEMVRMQIATHVTLPAFIAESCQFENVTEDGQHEWRRIFEAGLDAYFAAGGQR